MNIVNGDVTDYDILRRSFSEYDIDTVFHLAAISEVIKCQSDPKLAYDVNIGGTINILECARAYGNVEAIVVSSSDKAYGTGDRLPLRRMTN